MNDMGNAR